MVFGNGDDDVFLPLLAGRADDGPVGRLLFCAGGVDRDGKPRFALLFGADGKAVLSGKTDEVLHGGVVIDEHLHSLRRGERVDRLFRLYDRHRAGFAESIHGNHIKDLLISVFLRREYHIFHNRYIRNMDKNGGTIGSAVFRIRIIFRKRRDNRLPVRDGRRRRSPFSPARAFRARERERSRRSRRRSAR